LILLTFVKCCFNVREKSNSKLITSVLIFGIFSAIAGLLSRKYEKISRRRKEKIKENEAESEENVENDVKNVRTCSRLSRENTM
jgi:hypothetical protein